jgi:hypothetical protein
VQWFSQDLTYSSYNSTNYARPGVFSKNWHNFYLYSKTTAMYQDKQDLQPEENNEQPYTFSDETTKSKIKRHISNIDDVITENDIKNVKIPGAEKPVKVSRGKKRNPKNIIEEEGTEGNPVTPWDVLDE